MIIRLELVGLVALGGAIGSILRYLMGIIVTHLIPFSFPFATLSINILGGFLIGALFVYTNGHIFQDSLRALLIVGLLGGFTTFSAFSLETVTLFENGRYLAAMIYIVASVALSLSATLLGMKLLRIG